MWKSFVMLQKLKFKGFPEGPWALKFELLPKLSAASDKLNSYFVIRANSDSVILRSSDITSDDTIQQYMADYEFVIPEDGFESNGIYVIENKKPNTPSAEVHFLHNATDDNYDGTENITYTMSHQIIHDKFVNNSVTLLFSGGNQRAHAVYKVSVIQVKDDARGDDGVSRPSTSKDSGWRLKKRKLPKTLYHAPKVNIVRKRKVINTDVIQLINLDFLTTLPMMIFDFLDDYIAFIKFG